MYKHTEHLLINAVWGSALSYIYVDIVLCMHLRYRIPLKRVILYKHLITQILKNNDKC